MFQWLENWFIKKRLLNETQAYAACVLALYSVWQKSKAGIITLSNAMCRWHEELKVWYMHMYPREIFFYKNWAKTIREHTFTKTSIWFTRTQR